VSERAGSERGVSTRLVEVVVAVAILLLGAVVVYDSIRLGSKWGSDGPEAGYFPFYIGTIICICAVAVLISILTGRSQGARIFVTWEALKRVMQVLGPAAVFVLAIQLIGIYIASAAYIAAFMVWLGRYRAWLSAVIGVGVMAFFFVMFEVWFKVPLYKGLWDPLAFLGY
jgi:hypothetical protein